MAKDVKKGDKMHKGSGWTLTSPHGSTFPARLREVLHTGIGERVAIFYVGKRKLKKKPQS